MSFQSYINSPFNTSKTIPSTTTSSGVTTSTPVLPAAPVPALEIISERTTALSMPANAAGLDPIKEDVIYQADNNTVKTLFVPAGTYNATIFIPIKPQANNSSIASIRGVIVENVSGNVILSTNSESYYVGNNTDYSYLIFDTEDLITIPADITVRLEIQYANASDEFYVANLTDPYLGPLIPSMRFKTFSLPLVPALTIPPLTVPAITIPPLTD
jgi:hypothetical protein